MAASTFPAPDIDSTAAPKKPGSLVPAAPRWRDAWAAVLFLLHLVGIAVFSTLTRSRQPTSGTIAVSPLEIAALLATVVVTSALLTLAELVLFNLAATRTMHMSFIGTISLFAAAALYLALKAGRDAIVPVICSGSLVLVLSIMYLVFHKRIPFSAAIMKNVVSILRHYKKLFPICLAFWATGSIYLSFTMKAVTDAVSLRTSSAAWLIPLIAFSTFWTLQVIANCFQAVVAGTFATHYFLAGSGQEIRNPVASALRRSLTYSFGSICLGSLLVAILQTLRLLEDRTNRNRNILSCIISCVLDAMEETLKCFNYYAYTYIAIYGKSYIEAGRETWNLIKSRGFDAIANDNLIGTCCLLASICNGIVSGASSWLLVKTLLPKTATLIRAQPFVGWAVGVNSFLLGFLLSYVLLQILSAGATTFFVCLAQDPQVLQRNNPELYTKLMSKMPAV